MRVFRYRDFRLFWLGAFFSFTGSWVQNVAQGWLVYEMTNDAAKLAFVSFVGMVPVSIVGPFAGAITDRHDKKTILVLCQAIFALGALTLGTLTALNIVQYWHIVVIALINGFAGALEMPTRQSVVSRVVPPEELAAAIPIQAMTFNFARVVGPAIGGFILSRIGPQACYFINGFSYTALIAAILAIRADLGVANMVKPTLKELLFGGAKFTFQEPRLRVLFILEAAVSIFGIFYVMLMPAIARDMLGLDARGLGNAFLMAGVGAMSALIVNSRLAATSSRPDWIAPMMAALGLSLIGVAFTRTAALAFPLFAAIGFCSVFQFNTTNTVFQYLAPEHLRGRVLSMHVWALAGLSPVGTLAFGEVAERYGISTALMVGGSVVVLFALWGLRFGGMLREAAR